MSAQTRRGGPEPMPETAQDEVPAAVLAMFPSATGSRPERVAGCGPAFQDVLGILVTKPGGRTRRRVLLSLSAAETAVLRARARGDEVRVVLCRLQPIADLTPGAES